MPEPIPGVYHCEIPAHGGGSARVRVTIGADGKVTAHPLRAPLRGAAAQERILTQWQVALRVLRVAVVHGVRPGDVDLWSSILLGTSVPVTFAHDPGDDQVSAALEQLRRDATF